MSVPRLVVEDDETEPESRCWCRGRNDPQRVETAREADFDARRVTADLTRTGRPTAPSERGLLLGGLAD